MSTPDDVRTRLRPRPASVIGLAFALAVINAVLFVVALTSFSQGWHYESLRHEAGSFPTTLVVDRTNPVCYKGCRYESVGHYTDRGGHTVNDAKVTPTFTKPTDGTLRVIANPSHPGEVLQGSYTGAGYFGFGAIFALILVMIDFVLALFVARRRRRRRHVSRLLDHARAGGDHDLELRGIVRGPGIPSFVSTCDIVIGDDELLARDTSPPRASYTVSLQGISMVETLDQPFEARSETVPAGWQTTSFTTESGTYHLTCHADYAELLLHRLAKP